jgi:hypothetical protein
MFGSRMRIPGMSGWPIAVSCQQGVKYLSILYHNYMWYYSLICGVESGIIDQEAMTMPQETCKGEVILADRTISFSGPKDFVQEMIAKYQAHGKPEGEGSAGGSPALGRASGSGAEKKLISMKKPCGHHEKVAVLAFALAEAGTTEFGEEDIKRAYIRADVRPPKVIAQALRDAKNKFDYLIAISSGRYRLSDHGEMVVRYDLPRKKESA